MKCDKCGKNISILEGERLLHPENINELPKRYCLKCYNQIVIQEAEEIQKEKEETSEKKITEERVQKISKLSQPESELLSMIYDLNQEQKGFISKIEENVQTITTIMIIYFVLFLISLILTIISVITVLS